MNTIVCLLEEIRSAQCTALVLDALLKSFVVLGLAGLVCHFWRGASSATRHLTWFLALSGLLLLPVANPVRTLGARPVWTVYQGESSDGQVSLTVGAPIPVTASTVASSPAAGNSSPVLETEPRPVAARFDAHWVFYGWLVWLAGFLAVLVRLAAGQLGRRWMMRSARPLTEAAWSILLAGCCRQLGLGRRVRLWQSPDNVMPMTWGWWRPVVVLPAEASTWTEDRRRIVLLHELAHVKRGDCLTQTIAQGVCGLYWFNPLAWLAARQMCVEREGACDDLVLAGGCKASEYAGHLVEIAGHYRRVSPVAAIGMARSSQLHSRIAAIVDGSRNRRPGRVAAFAVLTLISGFALCLGCGGINSAATARRADTLRQQQIERLKVFAQEKEHQSEALAAAAGEQINPEFQRFFAAAVRGDWQAVTNLDSNSYPSLALYDHRYGLADLPRLSFWWPMREISLAYEQVANGEPVYTQMMVDELMHSIPPGSIYFGGTEAGHGLPTAFSQSNADGNPFYTLSQFELLDWTYLDYLPKLYGHQRDLLGQIAAACSQDQELQTISAHWNAAFNQLRALTNDEKNPQWSSAYAAFREAVHERKDRVGGLWSAVQSLQSNSPAVGRHSLEIPTQDDSQQCFATYAEDVRQRVQNNQLEPGENVDQSSGRLKISGLTSVMNIDWLMMKLLIDRNPGHEVFVEESTPVKAMYPYLEPHGLIFKLARQPVGELSTETVRQDQDYWRPKVKQMIGGWLDERTPLTAVTSFGVKTYLRHDLEGFTGDPRFVANECSARIFAKLRAGIAGLYAWHAEHDTNAASRARMAKAADFAFRQAIALCSSFPEPAQRYVDFLNSQHRNTDAGLVLMMADSFKSSAPAALTAASVFQIRAAWDKPAANADQMWLAGTNGPVRRAEMLYVSKDALLDGSAIESAHESPTSAGDPCVSVDLTDSGRAKFAVLSRQYLNQRLAMMIDGKLWSAPVMRSEIDGGKLQVTGNFTEDEARTLAIKINQAVGR
jgi:beta-lactamase regulating signal transducer with metallopeptidase domain